MKYKLLMALLLTAMADALAPAAVATTWYVNGVTGSNSNNCMSPTAACKTIGHAISLAASGDSIMVGAVHREASNGQEEEKDAGYSREDHQAC